MMGQPCDQSQIIINLYKDTTASREPAEQLKKYTARSPVTGTERGVLNREGDTSIPASRLSARESIPAVIADAFPRAYAWVGR